MPKFTKSEIEEKIVEQKKSLEGVIYYDKDDESYTFSVDKYTLAHLMKRAMDDRIKDIIYFKCTKSGKLTTTRISC